MRAGKFVAAHEHRNFFRVAREEYCFFARGKSAADDEELFSREKFSVAGRTVGDTAPAKFSFPFETDRARTRSRRDYDAERANVSARRFDGFYRSREIELPRFGGEKFRAEIFRLLPHRFRERLAGSAQNAGIIDDLVGDGDLSADVFALEHEHAKTRAGKVNCGGEPGGTGADNDGIVDGIGKIHHVFRREN